jgi:hypothetical protein
VDPSRPSPLTDLGPFSAASLPNVPHRSVDVVVRHRECASHPVATRLAGPPFGGSRSLETPPIPSSCPNLVPKFRIGPRESGSPEIPRV